MVEKIGERGKLSQIHCFEGLKVGRGKGEANAQEKELKTPFIEGNFLDIETKKGTPERRKKNGKRTFAPRAEIAPHERWGIHQ